MASAPKKRKESKELTLGEKLEVIKDYEKLNSLRVVAEKWDISHKTVQRIYNQRDSLKKAFEENHSLATCRINNRLDENGAQIDQLVWNWFTVARSKQIPISGDLIRQQALFFAKKLEPDGTSPNEAAPNETSSFKASPGWLEKWKLRHNVSSRVISGESAAVDEDIVDDFCLRLPDLVEGFAPENIFNADETGLFYRALPVRSLVSKNDACKGGKHAKERLTVLFCVSQTGEKIKPFVIGKSENPRCFRNLKKNQLPAIWRSNKKAWMTSALFEDFLVGFNNQMKKEKRKVLLFVDNAPSHPSGLEYSNVTVKYLPPNTTSHLQPLDQGIIRAFKAGYRKRVIKWLLQNMEAVQSVYELTKRLTVLDAIHWISAAWNDLDTKCIENCFRKAGFKKDANNDDDVVLCEDVDEDEETGNIFEEMQRFIEHLPVMDALDSMNYITADDDLRTDYTYGSTAGEIALEVFQKYEESKISKPDDSDDSDIEILEESIPKLMTQSEIMRCLKGLKEFCLEKKPDLYDKVFSLESAFNSEFLHDHLKNVRQSTLEKSWMKK